ncbi:hypothetical protein RvY_00434 [Ramazzottius varieornatus]|uniref:Uncharacterized protein n=1 Tax=Ramazzottius varieornatus TaxID=947166 RepID=A0A1D1UGV0_RAMVA|nr:hypothetical protein RvY_00434 [Ramazzottius varieornatus]
MAYCIRLPAGYEIFLLSGIPCYLRPLYATISLCLCLPSFSKKPRLVPSSPLSLLSSVWPLLSPFVLLLTLPWSLPFVLLRSVGVSVADLMESAAKKVRDVSFVFTTSLIIFSRSSRGLVIRETRCPEVTILVTISYRVSAVPQPSDLELDPFRNINESIFLVTHA